MFDLIAAYQHVAIRLPSDSVKIEQILPNTIVNLGKYGSFQSNEIIGRPYHLTFEILDRSEHKDGHELRVLKASEIHAETLLEEAEPEIPDDVSFSTPAAGQFDEFGLPTISAKSNINIVDDPNNQKLTYEEIEALKSDQLSNPKELISRIMANHSQLDQKTAFSLAKYTLRKQKKYMKRFTVLPLDVSTLANFMMEEKDFSKIMEIRNETLGLVGSWANVHASGPVAENEQQRCRYLVVDDTGGIVVAALAERMGLLHHENLTFNSDVSETQRHDIDAGGAQNVSDIDAQIQDGTLKRPQRTRYEHQLAASNTLTLVHTNQQPNLSLLRYFSFDPNQAPSPFDPSPHPLHTHLSTLTWLQLVDPAADGTYDAKLEECSRQEIESMKPNHRSNYYRKRKRWLRTREIVDCTREGNFDALIVASHTNPVGICKLLVPLLRGGAQVVVYSPHIEPLMELCDVYSTSRRTAYLGEVRRKQIEIVDGRKAIGDVDDDIAIEIGDDGKAAASGTLVTIDDTRFPVDPTLLLTPTVHSSTARSWQVLPGRTHPLMTSKGGAEGGYVMVSTRVIPVQGVAVQARGKPARAKKRQQDEHEYVTNAKDGEERLTKKGRVEAGDTVAVEGMET